MIETAVQKAIYTALNSAGLSAPVKGDVPQGSGFPYIVIGEDIINEWDTDTELGGDVIITIHTWSRQAGRKEIKLLQGEIYSALHRIDTLSATGYNFISCDFVASDSIIDPDGRTRHGTQTFRILIEGV